MLVRKVDHVLLRVDDVRAAWELFSGPLALPVAWPPFPYHGFLSAAVSLGECNLELLTPLPGGDVPEAALAPGARVIGIAFEPPTIDEALAELDRRAIPHGDTWPYEHRAGETVVASWTSLDLAPGWIPECPILLFVKYNRDQDAVWEQRKAAMAANGGGPLGITGLASITVAAADDGSRSKWAALFEGLPASKDGWSPETGPALRAGSTASAELTVTIDDLERATTMANQLGIAGRLSARGLGLAFGGAPLPLRLRDL